MERESLYKDKNTKSVDLTFRVKPANNINKLY